MISAFNDDDGEEREEGAEPVLARMYSPVGKKKEGN